MSPVILVLLGASSLVAGVFAVWLIAAAPPQVYRLERFLTVAVTFFVIGLVIGLPIAFLWRPARSIHVSASWGWPAFIALLSLLLGVVGFAIGRALPANRRPVPDDDGVDPGRPPVIMRRAITRGYRDALAFPWPRTPLPPPTWQSVERNLAVDLRGLLNQLGADDAR